MKDTIAVVRHNLAVARDTCHMVLDCDAGPIVPGQFVMLKVDAMSELFLRRPLAVLKSDSGYLELLYKLKGRGTIELSRKKPGEAVSVLGPLGKGFSMPRPDEEVVYLAGGTGLPPVMALAEFLQRGCFIFGARSKEDIPLWERISTIPGITALAVTEDGTMGFKGVVTEAFLDHVSRHGRPHVVYACGPHLMLKKVAELSERLDIRCEMSLEEYMACGFGVCSACAVKTESGNMRVCTHGPVFNARALKWGV